MTFIETLVKIGIQDAPVAVSAEQTSIPLLVAEADPGWDNSDVVRTYGSVAEMKADITNKDSLLSTYATRLMSAEQKPAYFLVGRRAGSALAASDLDAIQAANNSFYGIVPVKASDAEIEIVADWTEQQLKQAFTASSTAAIADANSKDNIAYQLQQKGYDNTNVLFSPASAALGVEASWMGTYLPKTPGTANPAYQQLKGVTADTLSTAQLLATVGNLVAGQPGNRANVYTSLYSQGVTLAGTTGGSTIYQQHGIHWLIFNLRAAIFSQLVSQKVDMTNKDVQKFVSACRGVLMTGVANHLIDPAPGQDADGNDLPGITVTAAPVEAINRQTLVAPTITATCTFAGPTNAVGVQITLQS